MDSPSSCTKFIDSVKIFCCYVGNSLGERSSPYVMEVKGEKRDHHIVPGSLIISEIDRVDKVEEDLSCFYATEVGISKRFCCIWIRYWLHL